MNVAFAPDRQLCSEHHRTDTVLVGEQQRFDIRQRPALLDLQHLAPPTVGQRVAKRQRQCAAVPQPPGGQKEWRVAQRQAIGVEREAGRCRQIAPPVCEFAGLHDAAAGELEQADGRSFVATVLREADIQRRRAPRRGWVRSHVRRHQ
ncbi:hypothetical protein [Variovorax sp. RHLX14]|uniref:hypothetical protein n=1 Tax=Variovorax sp. RHLX14 TaxID=1259731 RepID=UPI003F4939CE